MSIIHATGKNGVLESHDGGKTWVWSTPSLMVWLHQDRETHGWIADGFGTYGDGQRPLDALEDLLAVARKREATHE